MWSVLLKAGTILSFGLAIKKIVDEYVSDVNANRVYTSHQAARFLNMERADIVRLLRSGKIKGKLVKGNYWIPGSSILEYLRES
jgi:hypothetical protein